MYTITQERIEALASMGFEAYSKNAGGKTWDGKPIPPWSEVSNTPQGESWRKAALAIAVSHDVWEQRATGEDFLRLTDLPNQQN